jgi:hypothetical protein
MLDASRAECHLSADEVAELTGLCQVAEVAGHAGADGIFTGSSGKRRVLEECQRPVAAGPAAADVLDHPRGPPLAGQGTAWALVLTTGKVFIIGGRVIT